MNYKYLLQIKNGIINGINAEVMYLRNKVARLETSISNQTHANKVLTQTLNQIYTSRRFRYMAIVARIVRVILPLGSKRQKLFKRLSRIVRRILKVIIRMIPWRALRRYPTQIAWLLKPRQDNTQPLVNNVGEVIATVSDYQGVSVDGTIGIHLHLYYADLLPEFRDYLMNMPFKFDLFVSVAETTNPYRVKRAMSRITNARRIVVRRSVNRGRDFGPMFVLFGKNLQKYDYILHIHSKKTLRVGGGPQDDWRQYMLNSVLGSGAIIRRTFELLQQPDIGLVYPETYPSNNPYWGHTWLGVSGQARDICNKLGIPFHDSYLDFSAGSFNWIKRKAIQQLFDLNLTWEDFGTENGHSDGSLEYVLERIFPQLVVANGYNYVVDNPDKKQYQLNYGEKLLGAYAKHTPKKIINSLRGYDVISFDIFDTLITRKVLYPDYVFDAIEYRLNKENVIHNYKALRKRAEAEFRSKHLDEDCDIHQIYDIFAKITKLSVDTVEYIKSLEIEYEFKNIIPRRDMRELFNQLLAYNKHIVLVSDTYLTKDIVTELLRKCGYENYYDILISSELNKRKDSGTLWEYFFERYEGAKHIHLGDNEESDIHALVLAQRNAFHIMQGRKLFEVTPYGMNISKHLTDSSNVGNNTVLGLVINNALFNNAFLTYKDINRLNVSTLNEYAYAALGPLFLYFYQWLFRSLRDDKEPRDLVFVSREGYFLKKFYDDLVSRLGYEFNHINSHYFLASRRAVSMTTLQTRDDIEQVLAYSYTGTVKALFYYRLGIHIDSEDFSIKLPHDIDKIQPLIDRYAEEIYTKANVERQNYQEYIAKTLHNDRVELVDLGYSGTVQFFLSKLMDKKVEGDYFVVSNDLKPVSLGSPVRSCFNQFFDDGKVPSNPVRDHAVLLESFLTAPYGQFIRFDKNRGKLIEVYDDEDDPLENFAEAETIYQGILDFMVDYLDTVEDDFLDINIDKSMVLDNFKFITEDVLTHNSEMFQKLVLEDLYTQGATIASTANFYGQ